MKGDFLILFITFVLKHEQTFTMNKRRVVVTGLGMATSLGLEVEENWQKALAGTSGIHRLIYPQAEKSPVQAVGEVNAADWNKILEEFPKDAQNEGERRTLFALWAAKSALTDAGIIRFKFTP
jgi:3-oxoacyl-[acyl-carrier-protein] synthase II